MEIYLIQSPPTCWLAKLGDIGYTALLWINKLYNKRRTKQGKSYYSLSQHIKQKVKGAVSYISEFEKELVKLAEVRKVDGIICGHIHQPANTYYGSVHYLNAGDWIENLSALVENEQGEWNVVVYNSYGDDSNTNDEQQLYTKVI